MGNLHSTPTNSRIFAPHQTEMIRELEPQPRERRESVQSVVDSIIDTEADFMNRESKMQFAQDEYQLVM